MEKRILRLYDVDNVDIAQGDYNCGISELNGVNYYDPLICLAAVDRHRARYGQTNCVYFSGTNTKGRKNVKELVTIITEHKLGTIFGPAIFSNSPYSDKQVAYLWTLNGATGRRLKKYIDTRVVLDELSDWSDDDPF